MDNVHMTKEALIERLKTNRESHRRTFEQAMDVYQERMTELLESLIARAKAGKIIPHQALYELPMPEDHTDQYDVAIEMLGVETRGELVISSRDFKCFYLDQWEWSGSFASNTGSYVTS